MWDSNTTTDRKRKQYSEYAQSPLEKTLKALQTFKDAIVNHPAITKEYIDSINLYISLLNNQETLSIDLVGQCLQLLYDGLQYETNSKWLAIMELMALQQELQQQMITGVETPFSTNEAYAYESGTKEVASKKPEKEIEDLIEQMSLEPADQRNLSENGTGNTPSFSKFGR